MAAPPASIARPGRWRRRSQPGARKRQVQSFVVTLIAVCFIAAFVSPLLRSVAISLKNREQITQLGAPLYPADPVTFTYQGRDYDVYQVPIDGTFRDLALVAPGRQSAQFVDPANPDAGLITWEGSFRSLNRTWHLNAHLENFGIAWSLLDYPRLLFNTVVIAVVGMIGVLVSCTLVAYGFARFRFPGRNFLFLVLISTIFLPAIVTVIPTYTIWVKLGVVGSSNPILAWAPLLVPTFFANAFDVFLLRQYFMTIPRELDEAAAMDGAGPLRTLVSVVLPQAWPAIIAVGIFHFVYAWNDFFEPLIYLTTQPDLQPLAVGLQRFNGIHSREPSLLQAGTLMTLIVPVVIYVIFQRVFTRGIVITGVEK